ncbi:MAG: hypothetical protein MJ003_02845 [Paludibacteraceae bacterium]|nr:hypothetical protein [Paludibacteraceae bacterium]
MASRRGLKKDLNYLYSDLMLEAYAAFFNSKKKDEEKANALISKISDNFMDFVNRASHTDGKENKKLAKKYYKELWDAVYKDVIAISEEIDKL